LRVTQDADPIALGNYGSATSVDLVLYDFGAVFVVYSIALAGSLAGLLTRSDELYEAEYPPADSCQHIEQLSAMIPSAISKPDIADFVEDNAIFQVEAFTAPHDVNDLCTRYAHDIAQILRAELQPLPS
jgi:hypothetical protein